MNDPIEILFRQPFGAHGAEAVNSQELGVKRQQDTLEQQPFRDLLHPLPEGWHFVARSQSTLKARSGGIDTTANSSIRIMGMAPEPVTTRAV